MSELSILQASLLDFTFRMIKTNEVYNWLLFSSTLVKLKLDALQTLGYTGEGMDGLISLFLVFSFSFDQSLEVLS